MDDLFAESINTEPVIVHEIAEENEEDQEVSLEDYVQWMLAVRPAQLVIASGEDTSGGEKDLFNDAEGDKRL